MVSERMLYLLLGVRKWFLFKKVIMTLIGLLSVNLVFAGTYASDEHKLHIYQVDARIEAVDFDLTYEFERDILEQLSIAYLAIAQNFYVEMDMHRYMDFNVRVISSFEKFISIQKDEIGRIISHTGYYSLDTKTITVYKENAENRFFATLKHEACHRVLHEVTNNRVGWLNEGIAENCEFATYNRQSEKVEINLNKNNHKYVVGFAKKAKLIPLHNLLDWEGHNHQLSDSKVLRQLQSGEFIYFLQSQVEYYYWLSQLLEQDHSQFDVVQIQIYERMMDLQEEFELWLLE